MAGGSGLGSSPQSPSSASLTVPTFSALSSWQVGSYSTSSATFKCAVKKHPLAEGSMLAEAPAVGPSCTSHASATCAKLLFAGFQLSSVHRVEATPVAPVGA